MLIQIQDPEKITQLIKESAYSDNILAVSSICDTGCVFCSKKNNPPEIQSVDIGYASLKQILTALDFLDPGIPIIIGESAGIITEGEPTLNPQFKEIILLLIERFPHTPVEITTNGRNLDYKTLDLLKQKENLKLRITFNSVSIQGRKSLMNESYEVSRAIIEKIKYISDYGISFCGSLVALPNITGWEDIKDTIIYLCENNAETVEVHIPSYTRYTDTGLFPPEPDFIPKLKNYISSIYDDINCPVLIKPSELSDLTPVVNGVLKRSPAWDAGMRRGDIILSVNGRTPICRVDAWNMLSSSGKMDVTVKTDGIVETLEWNNPHQYCSGVTMEYDINPSRAQKIRDIINQTSGKVVLLTSQFAYEIMQRIMELYKIEKKYAEVFMVKNTTYGGNIRTAKLLTVDDYLAAIKDSAVDLEETVLLIVPQESFNCDGIDLKACHYSKIEKETGINVITF